MKSGRIRVLRAATAHTGLLNSKGGAAVACLLDGQSCVFISCHLEAANKFEERRAQYRELSAALGQKLSGHDALDLGELFHHIVWTGDMNYRCVSGIGQGERDKAMEGESCVALLESGRHAMLFKEHDQLSIEIGRREVFYEYEEPKMAPDFYPTYKKFENRGPGDYTNKDWVRKTYHVQFREPIYKGGRVKLRTPGWCDRVLFHSLHSLRDELRPEQRTIASLPTAGSFHGKVVKAPVLSDDKPLGRGAAISVVDPNTTKVDHYYAVNDGIGVVVSDHSPVVAAFTFNAQWRAARDARRLAQEQAYLSSHAGKDDKGDVEGDGAAFRGRAWNLQLAAGTSAAGGGSGVGASSPGGGGSSGSGGLSKAAAAVVAAAVSGALEAGARSDWSLSEPVVGGGCSVRLTGFELMVGGEAAEPSSVKVLFPLPFEAAFNPEGHHASAADGIFFESEIAVATRRRTVSDSDWAAAAAGGGDDGKASTGGAGEKEKEAKPSSSSFGGHFFGRKSQADRSSDKGKGGDDGKSLRESGSAPRPLPAMGPPSSGGANSLAPPPHLDVCWRPCLPGNPGGGVHLGLHIPDPEGFTIETSASLAAAKGALEKAAVSSGPPSARGKVASASRVPWLQLTYEGGRGLDELHLALTAKIDQGMNVGTCTVGLRQLIDQRTRLLEDRAKRAASAALLAATDAALEAYRSAEAGAAGGSAGSGAEAGDAAVARAADAVRVAAAGAVAGEVASRGSLGRCSVRCVQPLMFRGLPLTVLDKRTGEQEIVTSMFELCLIPPGEHAAESAEPLLASGGAKGVTGSGALSWSFSHRAHDGVWERYGASECEVIARAMERAPRGGAVLLRPGLSFEVRWGAAATSARMPAVPPSNMIQVNTATGNTRLVRRELAAPPPVAPKPGDGEAARKLVAAAWAPDVAAPPPPDDDEAPPAAPPMPDLLGDLAPAEGGAGAAGGEDEEEEEGDVAVEL